ncbi:hypothetical protein LCGC14_1036560 [marine sediment metagenome]|uniref:Uncharacterized protein n=1 Tax=marine sediment metagenome TaxID=412755 RepID=A0A0F9MT26_9ZZZZ
MDFELGWAILAGLIGGTVMAVILYMGIFMLPQQMKMNLFMILGTMVLPVGATAFVMGAMVHAGMSIVFGLIHGAVYSAADIDSAQAAWGLLFGLVHWAVVGMALGMLPLMHARIRSGEIDAPGFYALSYPPMTAMGFLMLHLVFGVIVGALYGAWAG